MPCINALEAPLHTVWFLLVVLSEEWEALWLQIAWGGWSEWKAGRRCWQWSVGKQQDKKEKQKRFKYLALLCGVAVAGHGGE